MSELIADLAKHDYCMSYSEVMYSNDLFQTGDRNE